MTTNAKDLDELGQTILKLGRFEGSAHGFRQAAQHLRTMAEQLEQAAVQAEEQAKVARAVVLDHGILGRARRALSAAAAGWRGPGA